MVNSVENLRKIMYSWPLVSLTTTIFNVFLLQGSGDKFYIEKQLLPENFVDACRSVNVPVILKLREDYDHSYYYIASFIGEHFDFHAKILKEM
jgi:S-formylglutathione hydrolase